MGKNSRNHRIGTFDFRPGRVLAGKYGVVGRLGAGWEGEVYRVRERSTGIERAAKFFFPHRNERGKTAIFYAKKLHKLRQCPILIQYHTQETITYRNTPITFLVSEFVEGDLLSRYLKRQRGGRMTAFEGLHLLHALAAGVEPIHRLSDYHGDLHDDNIIIRRRGISYDVKLVDMFHWGAPKPENIRDDVCGLVRVFYDAIGGQKHYAKQPPEVKAVCCGLRRSLILKKFRTAGQLRAYIESIEWT